METRAAALALLLLTSAMAAAEEPNVGPGGYEMTTYYVGFLYRGAKWTPEETPETRKIQEGHMANIQKLGAAGKLVIAGPFTDNGDLRGLYVFRAASAEEAKASSRATPQSSPAACASSSTPGTPRKTSLLPRAGKTRARNKRARGSPPSSRSRTTPCRRRA
jgi:uncharacterized protein YciI